MSEKEVLKCPKCGNKIEFERESTLAQEARIALLQHFSSKSTNQATMILTLVLAFFTFVQTLQYIEKWREWLVLSYESWALALLTFLGVRAVGRLIRWGELADRILKVEPGSEDKAENVAKKTEKESERSETYFERFYSTIRVKPLSRKVRAFDFFTNTACVCFLLLLSIASVSLLIFSVVSTIQVPIWIWAAHVVLVTVAISWCVLYYDKRKQKALPKGEESEEKRGKATADNVGSHESSLYYRGLIMGLLLGIIGNLFVSYFMEALGFLDIPFWGWALGATAAFLGILVLVWKMNKEIKLIAKKECVES
jgi:cytochrome c-type biogenesis protein CcmH/NrfF